MTQCYYLALNPYSNFIFILNVRSSWKFTFILYPINLPFTNFICYVVSYICFYLSHFFSLFLWWYWAILKNTSQLSAKGASICLLQYFMTILILEVFGRTTIYMWIFLSAPHYDGWKFGHLDKMSFIRFFLLFLLVLIIFREFLRPINILFFIYTVILVSIDDYY